jgi:hypothetical protein
VWGGGGTGGLASGLPSGVVRGGFEIVDDDEDGSFDFGGAAGARAWGSRAGGAAGGRARRELSQSRFPALGGGGGGGGSSSSPVAASGAAGVAAGAPSFLERLKQGRAVPSSEAGSWVVVRALPAAYGEVASPPVPPQQRPSRRARGSGAARRARFFCAGRSARRASTLPPPPAPPLVLSGHAASLTPY